MTGSCPLLWCAGPLAVYVLYKSSSKCNFILKIAYLYTTHMLMACVVSVLCLPRPRHPDNGLLAVKIMKPVNDLLGIQWTIEGLELLDTEESAVVVMNHQSSVDLLALFELWPHLKKVAPIAKKQILYAGPFGLACYLLGCVFIDRKSPTSREDVITAGVEAKSNGTKLLIFPEGTRNGKKGLSLLPFKKGAFHVALDTKMPILPIVVSEYNFLDSQKMIFTPGHGTIKVLPRIDTSGYNKENINDLVELTRSRMLETLKEISQPNPTHSSQPSSSSRSLSAHSFGDHSCLSDKKDS